MTLQASQSARSGAPIFYQSQTRCKQGMSSLAYPRPVCTPTGSLSCARSSKGRVSPFHRPVHGGHGRSRSRVHHHHHHHLLHLRYEAKANGGRHRRSARRCWSPQRSTSSSSSHSANQQDNNHNHNQNQNQNIQKRRCCSRGSCISPAAGSSRTCRGSCRVG